MVKDMCAEAGIVDCKTNHSLWATGATALFNASVPEKIIQKTTGHRSVTALHSYERILTEQHQAVGRVMMEQNCSTSFEKEVNPRAVIL